MEEIWKDIPEWEGFYQASTFGRVRSVDRVLITQNCLWIRMEIQVAMSSFIQNTLIPNA